MQEIIKNIETLRTEMKHYLISHLEDFELDNVDTHYVEYLFKVEGEKYYVKIWTANGKESAKFYEGFAGMNLYYGEYTEEEQTKLWNKAESSKTQTGEKRNISMTQMRNDLYFSFKGIFGQVKFSGYNDNDWWTKYRPEEIKEEGDVVWKIDLDKMTATYKPKDLIK